MMGEQQRTRKLPPELVDHIINVAIHAFAHQSAVLAKLCLVSLPIRQRARSQLYHSISIDRSRINEFLGALERDEHSPFRQEEERLSSLVKNISFASSSAQQPGPKNGAGDAAVTETLNENKHEHEHEHEHVELSDLLRCLNFVRQSVQGICIDMACSQMACGWYSDPKMPLASEKPLTMPNLTRLICRCPKGYLPTCTRKLLDLFHVGHSPLLVELLLYWTGPGSCDAPDNAESLMRTLQACPNVCRLRIVEACYATHANSKYASMNVSETEIMDDAAKEKGDLSSTHAFTSSRREEQGFTDATLYSQEVWIKSTSANGAVFRASSHDGTKDDGTVFRVRGAAEARLQAGHDGVLASQAHADSEAPPTAVSLSIARAARRIDRRKKTLRAHIATVHVPVTSGDGGQSVQVAETSVIEVKGMTHAHLDIDAPRRHAVHDDEGWSTLISLVQAQTQSTVLQAP